MAYDNNRDSRNRNPDHIQRGAAQMDFMEDRRKRDIQMGVIGQQGFFGCSSVPRYNPIVAPRSSGKTQLLRERELADFVCWGQNFFF